MKQKVIHIITEYQKFLFSLGMTINVVLHAILPNCQREEAIADNTTITIAESDNNYSASVKTQKAKKLILKYISRLKARVLRPLSANCNPEAAAITIISHPQGSFRDAFVRVNNSQLFTKNPLPVKRI